MELLRSRFRPAATGVAGCVTEVLNAEEPSGVVVSDLDEVFDERLGRVGGAHGDEYARLLGQSGRRCRWWDLT